MRASACAPAADAGNAAAGQSAAAVDGQDVCGGGPAHGGAVVAPSGAGSSDRQRGSVETPAARLDSGPQVDVSAALPAALSVEAADLAGAAVAVDAALRHRRAVAVC